MPAPNSRRRLPSKVAAGATAATAELANAITRDIQAGIYPLGAWLKQIDLEQRYHRNRNEIRRALERMAQLRVVAHVKNRGFHVFPADGREVAEIQDIRVILETAAAELIVGRAKPRDIAELERLANRFAQLVGTGTTLELYDANLAFHRAMLGICPNRELVDLVNMMHDRIPSAPATQWRTLARIEQSSHEHLQMVKALSQRDAPGLKHLITAHILQAH